MGSLLGPGALRALEFVATLARHDVHLGKDDVDAFVEARSTMATYDPYAAENEISTVDYLLQARLVVIESEKVRMTPAGAVMLKEAAGSRGSRSGHVEAVGRLSDPFIYADLLSRIDDIPDAMVVDPYLHPKDLTALVKLPSVRRVLTYDTDMPALKREDRARKLAIAVGAGPRVELRLAPRESKVLHDRLVLPDSSGAGLMLGTSLGAEHLTVVTRLSEPTVAMLHPHYTEAWGSATRIEPLGRA